MQAAAQNSAAEPSAPAPATPELLGGPTAASRAAQRIRSGRADTFAALQALERGESTETPSPPEKPTPTPEPVAEPETPVVEDEDGTTPLEPIAAAPADPETAKRLASVQAAEKRARAKLDAERAAFAKEQAELASSKAELEAMRAEVEAYRKARERAKVDPVSVLEQLGVDDLEYAAKMAYAKAKTDPNNKEAAARLMREREHASELSELRRRLDERDKADREREQGETIRRAAESYMSDVKTAATKSDVSPLAKHFLAKHPERTDARLRQIAVELLQETGDRPDPEDVLARYEQIRRVELEELGVDPSTIGAASAPATKVNTPTAAKVNAARTLANDLSTPRVPRPKSSEREHRAETLALLESGRLE